jgi:hypothetical protein
MKSAQQVDIGSSGSQRFSKTELSQVAVRIETLNRPATQCILVPFENPGFDGRLPSSGSKAIIRYGQVAFDLL